MAFSHGPGIKALRFLRAAAAHPFGRLCYAVRTFNRPVKPFESFLPIPYAILAGRP